MAIGTAILKIVADFKSAVAGLNAVTATTVQTARQMRTAASHIKAVGIEFSVLGGVISGVLLAASKKLIEDFTKFEQTLKQAEVAAGATSQEMKSLEGVIFQLALSTRFTAQELANAVEEMAKAGLKAEQITAFMKPIADFADATGSSFQEATSITIAGVNAFRASLSNTTDEIQNATNVVNALTAALNSSRITMDDLQKFMQTTGGTVAGFKQDATDVLSVFATMQQVMGNGARASVALNQALVHLGKLPLLRQKGFFDGIVARLEAIGLSAADIDPQITKLSTIFENFARIGISTAESLKIFGTEGSRAFNLFINNGTEAARIMKEMGDSEAGLRSIVSAEELANKARRTANIEIKKMVSSLDALKIALGDVLAETLVPYLGRIRDVITSAIEWVKSNRDVIGTATQLILSFGAIVLALGKIALVIGIVKGGWAGLRLIWASSIGLIFNIALGLTKVTAAAIGLGPAFLSLSASLNGLHPITRGILATGVAVLGGELLKMFGVIKKSPIDMLASELGGLSIEIQKALDIAKDFIDLRFTQALDPLEKRTADLKGRLQDAKDLLDLLSRKDLTTEELENAARLGKLNEERLRDLQGYINAVEEAQAKTRQYIIDLQNAQKKALSADAEIIRLEEKRRNIDADSRMGRIGESELATERDMIAAQIVDLQNAKEAFGESEKKRLQELMRLYSETEVQLAEYNRAMKEVGASHDEIQAKINIVSERLKAQGDIVNDMIKIMDDYAETLKRIDEIEKDVNEPSLTGIKAKEKAIQDAHDKIISRIDEEEKAVTDQQSAITETIEKANIQKQALEEELRANIQKQVDAEMARQQKTFDEGKQAFAPDLATITDSIMKEGWVNVAKNDIKALQDTIDSLIEKYKLLDATKAKLSGPNGLEVKATKALMDKLDKTRKEFSEEQQLEVRELQARYEALNGDRLKAEEELLQIEFERKKLALKKELGEESEEYKRQIELLEKILDIEIKRSREKAQQEADKFIGDAQVDTLKAAAGVSDAPAKQAAELQKHREELQKIEQLTISIADKQRATNAETARHAAVMAQIAREQKIDELKHQFEIQKIQIEAMNLPDDAKKAKLKALEHEFKLRKLSLETGKSMVGVLSRQLGLTAALIDAQRQEERQRRRALLIALNARKAQTRLEQLQKQHDEAKASGDIAKATALEAKIREQTAKAQEKIAIAQKSLGEAGLPADLALLPQLTITVVNNLVAQLEKVRTVTRVAGREILNSLDLSGAMLNLGRAAGDAFSKGFKSSWIQFMDWLKSEINKFRRLFHPDTKGSPSLNDQIKAAVSAVREGWGELGNVKQMDYGFAHASPLSNIRQRPAMIAPRPISNPVGGGAKTITDNRKLDIQINSRLDVNDMTRVVDQHFSGKRRVGRGA